MAMAGGSELFSSAEIAFLAKEELIQIMPKIRMSELQFLHVREKPIRHRPTHHGSPCCLIPSHRGVRLRR